MKTIYSVMQRRAYGFYIQVGPAFSTLLEAKKWAKTARVKGIINKEKILSWFNRETVTSWDIETLQRLPLQYQCTFELDW